MMMTPNFWTQVAHEIKDVLENMGLQLGMEVPGWPPTISKSFVRNRPY